MDANFFRCSAAALMFHMTKHSSGYFENMWFWAADHDIDDPDQLKLNVFTGRGVLIESHGPTWVHSASSEHSTLYQWQLSKARNIYLGHIQSETPYFQPNVPARQPYPVIGTDFPNDPQFSNCNATSNSTNTCEMAWALRIIESKNVYLYGGAFYSFFRDYSDSCAILGNCQDRIVELIRPRTTWLYDLWTIGSKEVVSPYG